MLIPGAGGDAWYWHLIERELGHRGHEVISVELPCDDDSAGLTDYTEAVIEAVGDRTDLAYQCVSFWMKLRSTYPPSSLRQVTPVSGAAVASLCRGQLTSLRRSLMG